MSACWPLWSSRGKPYGCLSVTESADQSAFCFARGAKKNPGGLAGDLSIPGLKIEIWDTQIGDDAVGSYALYRRMPTAFSSLAVTSALTGR